MQKIGYVFTFPVFMFTYIPISIAALVRKVEWKPNYHSATKRVGVSGSTQHMVHKKTCRGCGRPFFAAAGGVAIGLATVI